MEFSSEDGAVCGWQPSSNQEPNLLSWLEHPNFRGLTSHITSSSLVVEIFFLHCGVSHSSRKVSTCMPFTCFLRHLLSRSDLLKLRQRFSCMLGSIISEVSFTGSPPWTGYLYLPLVCQCLPKDPYYFPGLCLFRVFDTIISYHVFHVLRVNLWLMSTLPSLMFMICHYSLTALIIKPLSNSYYSQAGLIISNQTRLAYEMG